MFYLRQADKRGRTESGLFVAEGAKLISELRASLKPTGSTAAILFLSGSIMIRVLWRSAT